MLETIIHLLCLLAAMTVAFIGTVVWFSPKKDSWPWLLTCALLNASLALANWSTFPWWIVFCLLIPAAAAGVRWQKIIWQMVTEIEAAKQKERFRAFAKMFDVTLDD